MSDPSSPISALVFGGIDMLAGTLNRNRRLMRAAILYADSVHVLAFELGVGVLQRMSEEDLQQFEDESVSREFAERDLQLAVFRRLLGSTDPRELEPTTVTRANAAFEEISLASRAGALILPLNHLAGLSYFRAEHSLGAVDIRANDASNVFPARRRVWEGRLAAALLGELEAFPDASIDVLLDVRDRLTDARVYFRAAIAQAALELNDTSDADDDVMAAVADLRVRVVDPAVQQIRDDLRALGVRRTLLRVASDKLAVGGTAASLSMIAGAGGGLAGLEAIFEGVLMAPLIAAAAKETDYRATARAEIATRPYWLLHAAADHLRAQ